MLLDKIFGKKKANKMRKRLMDIIAEIAKEYVKSELKKVKK